MTHSALLIAVMAFTTMAIRALPFLMWGRGERKTPQFIKYLGDVLPPALIGMLVIYCLKDTSFTSDAHYGIPELISCAVVAGLQMYKHNSLISIIAGTVLYMILIRI